MHIVMEHIKGPTLLEYFERSENFSESDAARIMHKILLAVEHLHSTGIIHRDLKLENFIMEDCGNGTYEVKLIDFGYAKRFKFKNNHPMLTRI